QAACVFALHCGSSLRQNLQCAESDSISVSIPHIGHKFNETGKEKAGSDWVKINNDKIVEKIYTKGKNIV
ncbi:MAG: hypothetical protein PUC59_09970, partial [Firmicutes bacterium]|nr:hypothetical protein [Bacillota bacterium]